MDFILDQWINELFESPQQEVSEDPEVNVINYLWDLPFLI